MIPKVTIWKNGAGASVGASSVYFTGLHSKFAAIGERVYLALRKGNFHIHPPHLYYLKSHSKRAIFDLVNTARQEYGLRRYKAEG